MIPPHPDSRRGHLLTLTLAGALLATTGCDSRDDVGPAPPPSDAIVGVPGEIALVPGPEVSEPGTIQNPYSGDPYAIAEGQRFYTWYNCGACHGGLGGGGMGPPLRDGQWIYGGDPVSVYRSIMQGRPEGMPGFIGRITDDQVWRIVAFIEALEGDDFDFEPPLRPPRDRVHPSAFADGDGQLSPTEP